MVASERHATSRALASGIGGAVNSPMRIIEGRLDFRPLRRTPHERALPRAPNSAIHEHERYGHEETFDRRTVCRPGHAAGRLQQDWV